MGGRNGRPLFYPVLTLSLKGYKSTRRIVLLGRPQPLSPPRK